MIIDRQTAILIDSPTYTGRPCVTCGGTTRDTARCLCPPCTLAKQMAYRRANPEPRESKRARSAAWKAANPDKVREERRRHKARKFGVTLEGLRELEADQMRRASETRSQRKADAAAGAIRRIERQADSLLRRIKEDELKAEREAVRRAFLRADSKSLSHRERRKRYKRIRYELRREPDAVTAEAEGVLLSLQRGCCAYCGAATVLHLDHRHPVSKGGRHTWQNLQWLCVHHNQMKLAEPDARFRKRHGIPALTPWDWQTGLLSIAAEP